jgi:ribosomal protein S18 acetylase RimI-like enzyme
MPEIRPYRPGDLAAVSDVCLSTGDAGRDARGMYGDPDLLPDTFARPYLIREPDLAWVVDDGGRAVGYVLGTADTETFVRWYRDVWLPPLAIRYPLPDGPPVGWDEVMTYALHEPERMLRPELVDYPAHVHINLLPGYQRQGFGSRMMWLLLDRLRERGVPAVHLAAAKMNIPGRQFYRRLGFQALTVDDPHPVRYMGRSTVRDVTARDMADAR